MSNEVFNAERLDAVRAAKGDPPDDAALELAKNEARKAQPKLTDAEELEAMNVSDLKALADAKGIKIPEYLPKWGILQKIRNDV